jgi:hypothetical protein
MTATYTNVSSASALNADIAAVDFASRLGGTNVYRGLFVYSGVSTIENLTIENAVANGGAGGGGGGGGAGLGGGPFVANKSAAGAAPRMSRWTTSSSRATRQSAVRAESALALEAGDSAARAAH